MAETAAQIWEFVRQYPLLFLGSSIVLATFAWRQPRQAMKMLLVVGTLCVIVYFGIALTHFVFSGVEMKTQMVGKP